MTIKELVEKIFAINKANGWNEGTQETPLHYHMLIVSEIAEATEEVRNGKPSLYFSGERKPEGERIELADAVIRIAHYFALRGWNLEEALIAKLKYNETRTRRHGGKLY